MAILGSKKKVEKKEVVAKAPAVVSALPVHSVLIKPRVTEKSGIAADTRNIYTFEVTKEATKGKIIKTIITLYKVKPLRVNIINLPSKKVFVRGKWGQTPKVKKALVYLKKGDKIEFI